MVDIPESLLRRSAEAKAKALGVPVEQVLAEMKGEGPSVEVAGPAETETRPSPKEMVIGAGDKQVAALSQQEEEQATPGEGVPADEETMPAEDAPEPPAEDDSGPESEAQPEAPPQGDEAVSAPEEPVAAAAETEEEPAAAVVTAVEEPPAVETPSGDGAGDGKVAGVVSPRPVVPPTGLPEGVRTQRLLTVVKAGAIQKVKPEPTDKVNTWPHLMLMEFGALLLITGLLVIMAVVIHSPLLDPANFNSTPNPSKAPWYFLGLQELLSYFDPQIAGVMVPLFIGLIGFMLIPYVDKNPSTRPSDRKFAIMLYSIFLAGSATLTMIGVLFRGRGFNFSYPWKDGIFFDDLKDWVDFE
jgi:menaquinol-cytochrome c reductase cytochrome b/c subunit